MRARLPSPAALAVLALLPASPPGGARPDAVVPARLSFVLRVLPGSPRALVVEADLPGSPDGTTWLGIAPGWGGARATYEDLTSLEVADPAGSALSLGRETESRWRVEHEPGTRLVVRYALEANDRQTSTDPAEYRRTILNERLFHAVGELFLVLPLHLDDDAPVQARLSWRGLEEAGWSAACSFGCGPEVLSSGTVRELRQSILLAGELVLVRPDAAPDGGAGGLTVALQEHDWGVPPAALGRTLAAVLAAERAFFGESGQGEPFLVSCIPIGPARPASPADRSFGGSALTDSFSLTLQRGMDLSEPRTRTEVLHLFAHEAFHAWNGTLLRRAPPEEDAAWFTEGFTDFYARRLLLVGGWLDEARYLAELNEVLAAHELGPERDAPGQRVREAYWSDPDVQRLPYQRGELAALLLDARIRRTSGGERSLDELMRALVARGREGWLASTDGLLEAFAEASDREFAHELGAWLRSGGPAPLHPGCLAPRYRIESAQRAPFELGYDHAASAAAGVVAGVVPGSAAEEAGLRDGQALLGWSFRGGAPDVPARLRVRDDDGERELSWLPAGAPVRVPRLQPAAGAGAAEGDGR